MGTQKKIKSGTKGIGWDKRTNVWRVRAGSKDCCKPEDLGCSPNLEIAEWMLKNHYEKVGTKRPVEIAGVVYYDWIRK